MLLQAASGLERLMVGGKMSHISDSTVAQISAVLYYKANVIAQLESNKSFKENFKKIIFTQIQKDFGDYIDAQARSKPKSLHHVYEWKKVGNEKARLFKLKQLPSDGISFKIAFEFKNSRTAVPSRYKKKYIFVDKARVMEHGNPVIISPKNANRIVFEGKNGTVFMPVGKSVKVMRPGGNQVRTSFVTHYKHWFGSKLVSESIKKSGFFQAFQGKLKNALTVPGSLRQVRYSFSPGAIRSSASAAMLKEFGGALL